MTQDFSSFFFGGGGGGGGINIPNFLFISYQDLCFDVFMLLRNWRMTYLFGSIFLFLPCVPSVNQS